MLPTIAGLNNAETSLYAETQKGPTVSITEPPNRGHATVNLRLKELTLHTSFCFLLFIPPPLPSGGDFPSVGGNFGNNVEGCEDLGLFLPFIKSYEQLFCQPVKSYKLLL